MRKFLIAAAALIAGVGVAHATPITITGSSTSTFTNLTACTVGTQCRIITAGGNTQLQFGSTSLTTAFANPSTVTAPSSLAFNGQTNTTLTIGQLTWFNNTTTPRFDATDINFHWNLAVTFTAPPGSSGDSETFNLHLPNLETSISGFTINDLAGLSFTLPGVVVSNFQYHVTEVSGLGVTSLTCNGQSGQCVWLNATDGNTARLTITADFTAVPEPASLAALGTGLIAAFGVLRLRRRRAA